MTTSTKHLSLITSGHTKSATEQYGQFNYKICPHKAVFRTKIFKNLFLNLIELYKVC